MEGRADTHSLRDCQTDSHTRLIDRSNPASPPHSCPWTRRLNKSSVSKNTAPVFPFKTVPSRPVRCLPAIHCSSNRTVGSRGLKHIPHHAVFSSSSSSNTIDFCLPAGSSSGRWKLLFFQSHHQSFVLKTQNWHQGEPTRTSSCLQDEESQVLKSNNQLHLRCFS